MLKFNILLRLNVLLLLLCVASALYQVHNQYEYRRLFMALEGAYKTARELDSEQQRLHVEKRSQSASLRIESLAREQGLHAASPAVTHYVRDSVPGAPTVPDGAGKGPVHEGGLQP